MPNVVWKFFLVDFLPENPGFLLQEQILKDRLTEPSKEVKMVINNKLNGGTINLQCEDVLAGWKMACHTTHNVLKF